jgi:hypothetical protein
MINHPSIKTFNPNEDENEVYDDPALKYLVSDEDSDRANQSRRNGSHELNTYSSNLKLVGERGTNDFNSLVKSHSMVSYNPTQITPRTARASIS